MNTCIAYIHAYAYSLRYIHVFILHSLIIANQVLPPQCVKWVFAEAPKGSSTQQCPQNVHRFVHCHQALIIGRSRCVFDPLQEIQRRCRHHQCVRQHPRRWTHRKTFSISEPGAWGCNGASLAFFCKTKPKLDPPLDSARYATIASPARLRHYCDQICDRNCDGFCDSNFGPDQLHCSIHFNIRLSLDCAYICTGPTLVYIYNTCFFFFWHPDELIRFLRLLMGWPKRWSWQKTTFVTLPTWPRFQKNGCYSFSAAPLYRN